MWRWIASTNSTGSLCAADNRTPGHTAAHRLTLGKPLAVKVHLFKGEEEAMSTWD